MKRLFALLLALMLCLCACGENPQQNVGNLPEGFDESLFDEVEYDENGNLEGKYVYEYEYDKYGNLTLDASYYENGDLDEKYEYEYTNVRVIYNPKNK